MANNKLKILYLMRLLLERTDDAHGLSTEEIVKALDDIGISVERKALYNDLKALRDFGIDIEMRKEGGTRYYVTGREFELPELKLLVDAVQGSKFITPQKSVKLIKKLEGLASQYEARQLQRQVYVAGRIKTMNESIYYIVDDIHEAINTNSKIAFQYFDWNVKKEKVLRHGGKVYRVSPFALTWDNENYYLIAYDSENAQVRHYRVDKMLKPRVLRDERRDGAEHFVDFDMAQYSKKTFGMFHGKEETVALRCKDKMAGIIIDRFGQELLFTGSGDGYFEVRVRVAISPHFLTWLMNFGADVEILAPVNVREECVKLLKETLAIYEN